MTYLKPQSQSSRVIFDSFQFANNKNDDIILYLFTCKFFEFWLVTSLPLFVFSKKTANQFEFFHQSESRPRLSTEFVLSYEFSLLSFIDWAAIWAAPLLYLSADLIRIPRFQKKRMKMIVKQAFDTIWDVSNILLISIIYENQMAGKQPKI